MKTMQLRYWKFMVQLKAWILYLDYYGEGSYKIDKVINIVLAIASSASIAAWAIWNQLDFMWAIFIAITQVITAIKPHLPYSNRMDMVKKFSSDIQALFNKAEYNWYGISEGELTNDEINDLIFEIKRQYNDVANKYLKTESLPTHDEYKKSADSKAEEYFTNTYL